MQKLHIQSPALTFQVVGLETKTFHISEVRQFLGYRPWRQVPRRADKNIRRWWV